MNSTGEKLKEWIFWISIVAGILAAFVFIIGRGAQLLAEDEKACEAKGGTAIRDRSGVTCVAAARIPLR